MTALAKSLSENRPRRGGQAHFAHGESQNEPVPARSRLGSKSFEPRRRRVVVQFEPPRHTECAYYVAGTLRVPSPRQKASKCTTMRRRAGLRWLSCWS